MDRPFCSYRTESESFTNRVFTSGVNLIIHEVLEMIHNKIQELKSQKSSQHESFNILQVKMPCHAVDKTRAYNNYTEKSVSKLFRRVLYRKFYCKTTFTIFIIQPVTLKTHTLQVSNYDRHPLVHIPLLSIMRAVRYHHCLLAGLHSDAAITLSIHCVPIQFSHDKVLVIFNFKEIVSDRGEVFCLEASCYKLCFIMGDLHNNKYKNPASITDTVHRGVETPRHTIDHFHH